MALLIYSHIMFIVSKKLQCQLLSISTLGAKEDVTCYYIAGNNCFSTWI